MNVALIGCGNQGGRWLRLLKDHSEVSNVVTCDVDPDYESDYTHYWNLHFSEIDCTIVATPPHTHKKIARYFLGLGVPVLVEKPSFLSSRDLISMQRFARSHHTFLQVGYNLKYCTPMITHMKSKLWYKEVDRIVCRRVIDSYQSNIHPMWELGSHDVSLLLSFGLDMTDLYDVRFFVGEGDPCRNIELHIKNGDQIVWKEDGLTFSVISGNSIYSRQINSMREELDDFLNSVSANSYFGYETDLCIEIGTEIAIQENLYYVTG